MNGIPDDKLDKCIEDNVGGDNPDEEKVLVFLQPTPERILWIFPSLDINKFGASIFEVV